jgi:AraC-like DNA-binding protein
MMYVRTVISNLVKQRSILHSKYIQNKVSDNSEFKITTKDEKFLEDISRLIMENYQDPEFNIEKLVDNSYVSRTVFYHKIKTLTGLTPIDFLRQKRLHIASQLILKTDYNVSEIAVITGFNDVKNFSKRFKEIYKLTPTQFKQEMMSSN